MSEPHGLLPTIFLCALLGVTAARAQNSDVEEAGGAKEESGTPKFKPSAKPQYFFRANGVVEVTTNPDQTQTERVVPPAELEDLRARNLIPRIHAAQLFAATASIRPRQLAPGETGTLHVLVVLSRDTVVLPGSKVALEVFADVLPVTLGTSKVVPPRKGTLPGRFRDALVYDNVVEIRTPVTIAAGTEAKKYPIAGHVEIEIHSSTTGQRIGEFYSGIDGWLKVGRSLATATTPNSRRVGGSTPSRGSGDSSSAITGAGGVASPDVGPGGPDRGGPDRGGRLGAGRAESSPRGGPNDGDATAAAAPNPVPWSLLSLSLGGLVLLGLIVALLARKRAG
jgi:hypothetical protein